jgi:hypothetical protein
MYYVVYVMQANCSANMPQLVWFLCTVKGSTMSVHSAGIPPDRGETKIGIEASFSRQ